MKYAEFKKIRRITRKNSPHLRVETERAHDDEGRSVPMVIRFSLDPRQEKSHA